MNEDRPKKSLGQHWLNDASCLAAMCDAAAVSSDDVILEIGPGQGSLTRELLKRAKKVIAIEKDEALASALKASELPNLEVIEGDILRFDFSSLPAGYKVVANIPYYLTSNLIRVLSESSNPPQTAVLLVQKEVAERMAAQPGKMSLLAVTAQFYWQVSLGRVVRAELFEPPPKVDSQIIILSRYAAKDPGRSGQVLQKLFAVDEKSFFRLVKAGFSQKRKTLENSLSAGLAITKLEARQLLNSAGILSATRAQSLSLFDWYELFRLYSL